MSDRVLRTTMVVLGTIGLGVASYLTYVHYSGAVPLCGKNGGSCLTVQTSTYSKLAGVPVPVIGLVGYVSILVSLLIRQSEATRLATLGFTIIGFLFSAYLTGREVFTIEAICEWCVSSAVIMTILMCLALWQFLRATGPQPAAGSPAAGGEGSASDGLADGIAADGAPVAIN